MLLRRIIEHVKAQNWFAVGLDFVTVVAGVFIGLQVQQWNEARKDAVQHEALLERLAAEFRDLEAVGAKLVATGRLPAVRNVELRKALIDYGDAHERLERV